MSLEYNQDDVDYLVAGMVRIAKKRLMQFYPDPKKTPRDAHPKTVGLLKATFTVTEAVPKDLQVGVFAQPNHVFPAYVRFSNSLSPPTGSDATRDFRGVAIKLTDENEQHTVQDFVLINKEDFPLGTPWMFFDAMYWADKFILLVPLVFLLKGRILNLLRAWGKKTATLAAEAFYSTTPFAIGVGAGDTPITLDMENTVPAVKYALIPHESNGKHAAFPAILGKDYLRDELKKHLREKKVLQWDFCVQRRTDPKHMPLNDVSVVWKSQFVKLATLEIHDQEFHTAARLELAEQLAFNVSHVQPEHQPIGIMNRVRLQIYDAISKFRHERAGRKEAISHPLPMLWDQPKFTIDTV